MKGSSVSLRSFQLAFFQITMQEKLAGLLIRSFGAKWARVPKRNQQQEYGNPRISGAREQMPVLSTLEPSHGALSGSIEVESINRLTQPSICQPDLEGPQPKDGWISALLSLVWSASADYPVGIPFVRVVATWTAP